MKKRLLSLFLSITIMLGLVLPSSAAGGLTLSVGEYEAYAGQKITVNITVENNPGTYGMSFSVEYDDDVLTPAEVKKGGVYSTLQAPILSNNPLKIITYNSKDTTANGAVLTIDFMVAEDAAVGKNAGITITSAVVSNFNEETVPCTVMNGFVKVIEEPQTYQDFGDIFEFTDTSVVYNGETRTPGVVLKDGCSTDAEWNVSYSMTPRNVGIYNIKAEITATGYNPKVLECNFEIAPKDIQINIADVLANVGDPYSLSYAVDGQEEGNGLAGGDYVTGNPAVSPEHAEGSYPITPGTLRIIDIQSGKESGNYNLTFDNGTLTLVNVNEESIELNLSEVTLREGESAQLAAIFTPANTTVKTTVWSANSSLVTVEENGVVTAGNLESGYSAQATVTAESANGKTASCVVTVVCAHHIETVNAVEADCKSEGNILYYICHDCGKLFSDAGASAEITDLNTVKTPINSDNHAYETVTVNALTPTEDAEGYTGDEKCTGCNTFVRRGTAIPKLKHTNHVMTACDGVTATCIAEGSKAYWTCENPDCAGVYYGNESGSEVLNSIVIPKNPGNHASNEILLVNAKEATCTEKGYTGDSIYNCCGALSEKGSSIATKAHTVDGEWLIDQKEHYRVCSVCHNEVQKSAHTGNAATCTAAAVCTICGYTDGVKAEHVLVENKAVQAGCTDAGRMEYWQCSQCGNMFADEDGTISATAEGIFIAPRGHKWGEWIENEEGTAAERSCVAEGCEAAPETRTITKISAGDMSFNLYQKEDDQTAELEIKVNFDSNDDSAVVPDDEGVVTIDVSNLKVNETDDTALDVTQVSIPAAAVSSVAEDEKSTSLEVNLSSATVSFNADALNAITGTGDSEDGSDGTVNQGSIALKVDVVENKPPETGEGEEETGTTENTVVSAIKDGMNNDQVNAVNDKLAGREVYSAVDISLSMVGTDTNTDLGKADENGKGFGETGGVTITIPFNTPNTTKTNYKILYIFEDGSTEEIDATYADGSLTFTVSHFSQFIVVDPIASGDSEFEYALLSNAVSAAEDNAEITLLANVDETVEIGKPLTILLNGHSAPKVKAGAGFVLVPNSDESKIVPAAAKIGDSYFATVSDAVDKAAGGSVIEVSKSYISAEEITVNKAVTIKFAKANSNVKFEAGDRIIMTVSENKTVYEFQKATAAIGNVYYKTFDEALENAADNEEITLLASVTEPVEIGKAVTIKLNGNTANITAADKFVMVSNAEAGSLIGYRIVPAAAKIGEVYYETVAKALEKAADNNEIVVLGSYNGAETITVRKLVKIVFEKNNGNVDLTAGAGFNMTVSENGLVYTFGKASVSAGDKNYASIEEAIADGVTEITLLADVESVTFNAPVTIHLNGFEIHQSSCGSSDDEKYFDGFKEKIERVFFRSVETEDTVEVMLIGDADSDNLLELEDIELLKAYFAGKTIEGTISEVRVDADGNDTFERRDLMILSRYTNGWKGYETLPYQPSPSN